MGWNTQKLALVYHPSPEKVWLLKALAEEMGYRVVKKKAKP